MKRIAITYSNPAKLPPYADAIRALGAEPVPVSPADGLASLDGFAGLLVSGGNDVNPSLYGHTAEPRTHAPDDARDSLETGALREAFDRDLPVLAICRGMQLFNVVHSGGTLLQHIEGHEMRPPDASIPAHRVTVTEGTWLAKITGQTELPVNSRHHQAVSTVGDGLVISAVAPDGIIEGIERPDRRFAVAVQWHPEDQLRFAEHRRLFEAFLAEA
jgi:putative glutamine amidotransferase